MKINALLLKVSTGWRRFKTAVSGKLTTYDSAEVLTSEEAIETFMVEAFKTKDPGFIAYADDVIARARTRNTSADGILAHAKDRMKALGIKLRIEGLYSRRPWSHLGLLASIAVAVVAGGWAVHLVLLYQDSAHTATHSGVISKDIQSSLVTHTESRDIILDNQYKAGRDIPIGITIEQHKAGLKKRKQEVTERLKQAHAEDRRILEEEKAEIERQLADIEELKERISAE